MRPRPRLELVKEAFGDHEIGSKIHKMRISASNLQKRAERLPNATSHNRLSEDADKLSRDLVKNVYDMPEFQPHIFAVVDGTAKEPSKVLKAHLKSSVAELKGIRKRVWSAYNKEHNEGAREALEKLHHNTAALENTLDLIALKGHRGYVTGGDLRKILRRTSGRKFPGLAPHIRIEVPRFAKLPISAGNLTLLLDNLAENVEKASRPVPGANMQMLVRRTPEGLKVHVRNLAEVDPKAFEGQQRLYNGEKADFTAIGSGTGGGIVRNLLDHYKGRARVWTEPAPKSRVKGASYYNIECEVPLVA